MWKMWLQGSTFVLMCTSCESLRNGSEMWCVGGGGGGHVPEGHGSGGRLSYGTTGVWHWGRQKARGPGAYPLPQNTRCRHTPAPPAHKPQNTNPQNGIHLTKQCITTTFPNLQFQTKNQKNHKTFSHGHPSKHDKTKQRALLVDKPRVKTKGGARHPRPCAPPDTPRRPPRPLSKGRPVCRVPCGGGGALGPGVGPSTGTRA